MKPFLALLGLLLLPFTPAWAQTVQAPQATAALVCAYNSSPPAITSGNFAYVQCDASGHVISSSSFATVPFTATGGTSTSSVANRATDYGVKIDAKADAGLACDGTTNDNAAFVTWLAANQSLVGTLVFSSPSLCLVNGSGHAMPPGLTLESRNGGGLKIASAISASTFKWLGNSSGTRVRNLIVDVNSQIPTGGIWALFQFNDDAAGFVADRLDFENNYIINAGQPATSADGLDLVRGYGWTKPVVRDNLFGFVASSPNHNQTVNIGSPTHPITDMLFTGNVNLNSGYGQFGRSGSIVVTNNIFKNCGFGACITTEPLSGAADASSSPGIIGNNTIDGTPAALDWLGTQVRGIENAFGGVAEIGNVIKNTCGPSITTFSPESLISGNDFETPGTCNVSAAYNSAILLIANGGGNTAANTFITGNHSSGGDYGVSAVASATFTNVNIGDNDFRGALGKYNIAAASLGISYTNPTPNRVVLGQSRVPMILPSSGSMANNGALTLTTALDQAYPSAYFYMPAGAIVTASAAGFYYGTMSSTTAVTLFNNPYVSGSPTIPGSPTAFATTGPGAYTQTTGSGLIASQINLAASTLGAYDEVQIHGIISYNNSAGAKSLLATYGAFTYGTIAPTTTVVTSFQGGFANAGSLSRQTQTANTTMQLTTGASAPLNGAINSAAAQSLFIKLQLATATDYVMLQNLVEERIPASAP